VDGQEGETMGIRRIALLLGLTLGLATAIGLAGPARADKIGRADQGGRPLHATLTGANEAPGPGDPDGTGTALITLNQGQGTVCFELSVQNITLPASAAHIHVGPPGVPGPIVIPLTAPGADGTSSGCVENVDRDLIKAIRQNPDAYYVNVHTLPGFGAGAVRGQLSK
jgi:CHRD domain